MIKIIQKIVYLLAELVRLLAELVRLLTDSTFSLGSSGMGSTDLVIPYG